ncbi:probable ATP-dependent RNA helicase DDX53 [Pieris napi]|uniref:probable ATP-dependent RNA helicase DDX53 n=1 Tax=Pieris napi TaxID=78633 RepID=UPI001FBA15E2|nr:probable ATP-dependent RNA helicase DDX53 [Pieris napi]
MNIQIKIMSDSASDNNYIPETVTPVGQIAPPQRSCQSGANYSAQGQIMGSQSNQSIGACTSDEHRVTDKVISIPTATVGRVVGRRGFKLRDLESGGNVKIKIGDSSGDNTDITLFGTDFAIAKVEKMIKDLTIDRKKSSKKPAGNSSSDTAAQAGWSSPNTVVNSEGKEAIAIASTHCDQAKNVTWVKLPHIVKNFYKEDPVMALMSQDMVTYWREYIYGITVKRRGKKLGVKEIPNLLLTFEQAFKDYPEILDKIHEQGLTKPLPIQSQAWPILLKGEDVICIAQKGAGKTLAFLLPALIHVGGQPTPREQRLGPTALIVAPTKQLAIQIQKEFNKYHYKGITSVCCIHGRADRQEQIDIILKGVDIVITTPGRLFDLIIAKHVNVRYFSYIVLDEVDQMLDMGFGPQINLSLTNLRSEHQFVMTSVTLPATVRHLADAYMHNPVYVNVGSSHCNKAVHTITQKVRIVEQNDKFSLLRHFICNMGSNNKVLIFCATQTIASNVTEDLAYNGFDCKSLLEDQDQSEFEAASQDTTDDTVSILVAADIAAQDIDMKDLTHVINFDFPLKMEEYVHRIGLMGKSGRKGIVISLMTKNDSANASDLINILKEVKQEVPGELQNMADWYDMSKMENKRGRHGQRGRKQ